MIKKATDIQLLVHALTFAAEKHITQRRKSAIDTPYINHPIALENVLANEGNITNVETLCAAALHDTIEDTKTTVEELKLIFGEKITAIVLDLTDDKSLPKETRKELQIEHATTITPEAKLVKLADKICNLRDILTSPPTDWPQGRKQAYFDWAARVVDQLRGTHTGLETLFDETYSQRCKI